MRFKVNYNDNSIVLDKLEKELNEIEDRFVMPRWSFLQSEWNNLIIKKAVIMNKVSKIKKELSNDEVEYCNVVD